MRPGHRSSHPEGMTLRQAALVAGFAYLLNPVSYAEFSIYPKLVIAGNIVQTAQNIAAHQDLFLVAIGCYFLSFVGDVILAWSLYILLAPVNRSLSLLMAWFQLVYAALALVGVASLVNVHHLLTAPEYLTGFGPSALQTQVWFALHSFRYTWQMSLILFGIHLVLLGYLIYRSGYIPRLLGVLLVINGVGWMIDSLRPYLWPHANLGFVFITFFGELLFMLWLLIRGWKIKELPAVR